MIIGFKIRDTAKCCLMGDQKGSQRACWANLLRLAPLAEQELCQENRRLNSWKVEAEGGYPPGDPWHSQMHPEILSHRGAYGIWKCFFRLLFLSQVMFQPRMLRVPCIPKHPGPHRWSLALLPPSVATVPKEKVLHITCWVERPQHLPPRPEAITSFLCH